MWEKLKVWFNRSEVILFARAQMVTGAVWAVLQATDLSPVLQGKYMTYWLICSGVVTELCRRRGTTTATDGTLVGK